MDSPRIRTAAEEKFIGLSKKGAQNLAEAKSMIFRLVRVGNDKFFDYPTDFVKDRVSVEINEDNKVVEAKIG